MRGLDPRIHLKKQSQFSKMDCRVKPGNDEMNGRLFVRLVLSKRDNIAAGSRYDDEAESSSRITWLSWGRRMPLRATFVSESDSAADRRSALPRCSEGWHRDHTARDRPPEA